MTQSITLNIRPLSGFPEAVEVCYREATAGEKREDHRVYLHRISDKEAHWISFSPKPSLSKRKYIELASHPWLARHLATEALFDTAKAKNLRQFHREKEQFFENSLEIVMENPPEGHRVMTIRPISSPLVEGIGILLLEHFHVCSGVPYSRKIQIHTGSLDSSGRPNSQYHVQAWQRLIRFLAESTQGKALLTLKHDATGLVLNCGDFFPKVSGELLHKRRYEFGADAKGVHRVGDSQLYGVRDYGPYAFPDEPQKFLTYISKENDRPIARILYQALHNGRPGSAFEGFRKLFRYDLPLNPDAKFISLRDFSVGSISQVVTEMAKAPKSKDTIAVIIIPREMENNEEMYIRLKATLLSCHVPSQFCTRELTSGSRSLEWAAANLALGLFAKLGGTPWRVASSPHKTIILGVAQSVEWVRLSNGKREIIRQIAYSILTDSTGEFRKLVVLADVHQGADASQKYLQELKRGLGEILEAQAGQTELVVLHVPFRPKREFIDAIQESVAYAKGKTQGTCEFAVIKINDPSEHSWFGYLEEANSMVPIESTLVRLNHEEYLLWFEGQDEKRRLSKKRYGGPTHIRFLTEPPSDVIVRKILDDLVDLAGANWRGFNARSEPVSVYYCYLIAKFMKNCHRHGVALPDVGNLHPWFL